MSYFTKRHFQDIDTKELIQHYKQYECLWDINNPDYKDHETKYQAWKEIADYFNKDVEEVKRKIKNLRSAYIAEKKKVEASKKSGGSHKPNLYYYDDLDFLDKVVVWRKFNVDFNTNDTEYDIDTKELIQHYKQYECLWDINNPDYKDHETKYQAWKEIADYFNKDVEEVKRKIKYLRSAYIVEKKKVEASKTSGGSHKPNLFYYDDLDFLDKVVVWRKFNVDFNTNNTEFEREENSQNSEEEEDMLSFENRIEEVDFKESDICKTEVILEPEPDLSPPQRVQQHQMTIRNTPLYTQSRSEASKSLKRKLSEDDSRTKKSSSTAPSNQPKNLYMTFAKMLSLQLQQLPMDVAVLTMSEIHTILTKKTLEHIRSEEHYQDTESEESYSELIEETTNDVE